MAKKLSSRELAVKAKKKATPKLAPRAVASKSPLVGAGPLMTGQTRVGGTVQGAGPLLPGQKLDGSYTGGTSSRDMASRAQQSSSYSKPKKSLLDRAGDLAGSAGAALRKVPGLKQIGEYGDDYVNTGNKASLGKVMAPFAVGAAIPAGMFAAGAGAAGGLSSLAGVGRGVIGRGIGNLGRGIRSTTGEIAEGAAARLPSYALPTVGATAGGMAAGQLIGSASSLDPVNDESSDNGQSLYEDNTPLVTETRNRDNEDNKKDWVNPWGKNDVSGENSDMSGGYDYTGGSQSGVMNPQGLSQEELRQLANEKNGGDPLKDTPFGTQDNASGRGSGKFGTGKGLQGDDDYIKELRKSYASNGGEKWLRQQFEELIKALDPTYAALQTEGTNALNENLRNNSNQLASVMNAGNVGDSEQRAQQLAGLQQGNQTALGQLLAKLAQGKASDTSGYRSQMAEGMGKLQDRNQSNQQRLMEQIQQYRNNQYDRTRNETNDAFDQKYKMASLNQKGSGSQENMSLKAIKFDKFGNETQWVDQSTGDIYENDDF